MKKVTFNLIVLSLQFFCLTVLAGTNFPKSSSSDLSGANILSGKFEKIGNANSDGTVVVFLSASCPCSNSHIQELKDLAKQYPKLQFFGVHSNANEDVQSSKMYFQTLSLPFSVIQDTQVKIADHFKALKTPHAFLLDSKGTIVYQGGVSDSNDFSRAEKKYLRNAIEDLSNNRPIRISEARTLGCTIERESKK